MTKECPVILNNEVVTVVKYNEISVQFPSVKRDVKTVFVEYKDGKYFIVDKNTNNSTSIQKMKKRSRKKNTVVKDQADDVKNESATDETNNVL